YYIIFYLYVYLLHRHLLSFPTRRSSDLAMDELDKILNYTEPFSNIKDIPPLVNTLNVHLDGLLKEKREEAKGKIELDRGEVSLQDRKSTRLNSSHVSISYAVFCLKKKKT